MITLETDRLILRNFTLLDWEALYAMVIQYQSSPMAAYDQPWPTSIEEIKSVARWFGSGDAYLAVSLKESGQFIGFIGLTPEPDGRYSLGYVFEENFHGKGYAIEACRIVLEHAFNDLEAVKIVAGTGAVNFPSQRLLEKLGFHKTGEGMVSFRNDSEGKPIEFLGFNYELRREWRL